MIVSAMLTLYSLMRKYKKKKIQVFLKKIKVLFCIYYLYVRV